MDLTEASAQITLGPREKEQKTPELRPEKKGPEEKLLFSPAASLAPTQKMRVTNSPIPQMQGPHEFTYTKHEH